MFYIADLHIHSHYAAATSKFLCLETLYQWAMIKGIDVVGTGDFTHPGWLKELEEKLQPEENGFYTLKQPPPFTVLPGIKAQQRKIMFCLSAEINCEYKIGDKVYKNHHLIYAPDIETVRRIITALSKYADLSKDGRPTFRIFEAKTDRNILIVILSISLGAAFASNVHIMFITSLFLSSIVH